MLSLAVVLQLVPFLYVFAALAQIRVASSEFEGGTLQARYAHVCGQSRVS